MKSVKIVLSIVLVLLLLVSNSFSQTTIVKGKLLDVDGKPSQYALVGYLPVLYKNGRDFVKCDDKGNYTIKLTKPGYNHLIYSIPSHRFATIPVLNNKNKTINIDVTLAPYKYRNNFDNIAIAGKFSNYADKKMIKNDDGTFRFEVQTEDKEVGYWICGIEMEGRRVNSPEGDSFFPDSSGDYLSIQNVVDGKATIVFDPSKLLRKDGHYKVSVKGSDIDAKIISLLSESDKEYQIVVAKRQEHLAAKKNYQDFHYDAGTYLIDIIKKIKSEKNEGVKNYLKLIYLSYSDFRPINYDYELAAKYFESIKPSDLEWDILPSAFYSCYNLIPQYRLNEIMDKFWNESKCSVILTTILGNKLSQAKYAQDVEQLKNLHSIAQTKFKDIKEAQDLLSKYPIESKVKVGTEIPDFEVVSLDNADEKFSKKSMLGKIYLIDFWATWCGPCVGEMETLHSAFEKFKDKGFEILSLSLDGTAEDVIKFRKDKFKMPWMNSFIGDPEGRKIAQQFEVIGIPRPILVDANGKVLELEMGLRGGELEATLEKYFK